MSIQIATLLPVTASLKILCPLREKERFESLKVMRHQNHYSFFSMFSINKYYSKLVYSVWQKRGAGTEAGGAINSVYDDLFYLPLRIVLQRRQCASAKEAGLWQVKAPKLLLGQYFFWTMTFDVSEDLPQVFLSWDNGSMLTLGCLLVRYQVVNRKI